MSSHLQTSDGDFATAIETEGYLPKFPFLEATGDRFARLHLRLFEIARGSYVPTLADRAGYTNLLSYSADPSNAAWANNAGVTCVAAAATNAWDGSTTAATVRETAANTTHGIGRPYTFTAAAHTWWIVVERVVRDYVILRLNDGTDTKDAAFDLANGRVFSASAGVTAAIFPLGDSRFICAMTWTPLAATGYLAAYPSTDGSAVSFAGSTSAGFNLSHAQLELASAYTTPVPTTSASRTITAPALDPEDPFAFQAGESEPSLVDADILRVGKLYARIPATQYLPGSLTFARPDFHGYKSGSYYAVSFDDGRSAHLFSSRKTISNVAPLVASTVTKSESTVRDPLPTSGTVNFTLSNGNSGTFDFSDSSTTILNALIAQGASSGNTIVSKSPYTIDLITAVVPLLVAVGTSVSGADTTRVASGSWRISAPGDTTTSATDTASIDASIRRFTTSAAHSAQVGDYVAMFKGDKIVALTKCLATPTTTTFDVPLDDVAGKDFTADTVVFSSGALWRIAIDPPVTGASARRVQRFYLPGFTAGITNTADVPKFEVQIDPVSWLAAVVAYLAAPSEDSYFIAESGDVSIWRGPILMKEVTEIQMQDVVTQLNVNA